jgi:hypothetical protein
MLLGTVAVAHNINPTQIKLIPKTTLGIIVFDLSKNLTQKLNISK